MNLHPLVLALSVAVAGPFLSPAAEPVPASTTAQYRDFRLGEPIADVAKQTGLSPSDAKLISSRPERVEELTWRTGQSLAISKDSVRDILFRFDNGALFEMLVTYDRNRTGGLTDQDMTEALAAIYGPA